MVALKGNTLSIGGAWRQRTLAIASFIVLLFSLNVVRWSTAFPYNSVPDEHVRFYMIEHLEKFDRLPSTSPPYSLAFSGPISGDHFAVHEWWYYGLPNLDVIGAWGTTHLLRHSFSPWNAFLSARVFNWVLAPLFATFLLLVGWEVSERRFSGLLGSAVVLAIPQITFIFSYVNSDALSITACTAAVYFAYRLVKGATVSGALLLGVALGIVAGTKLYYYPVIPAALIISVIGLAARSQIPKRILVISVTVVSSLLMIAAIILIPTYLFYNDAFGLVGQQDFVLLHKNDPAFRYGTCFVFCQSHMLNGPELKWWLKSTFESFFFAAGYLDILLPNKVYSRVFLPMCIVLALLTIVALMQMYSQLKRIRWPDLFVICNVSLFWFLLIGTICLNILGQQGILPQPQGRYLFVTIPFLVVCLAALADRGSHFEVNRLSVQRWRDRHGSAAVVGIALSVMVVTNVMAYRTAVTSDRLVTRGDAEGRLQASVPR